MAKKTTKAAAAPARTPRTTKAKGGSGKSGSSGSRQGAGSSSDSTAVDALLKLLESPLVADLLAVGATAALAAVAEHRSSRRTGTDASAKRVVKEAGRAAAAAMGRRLASEFEEIRKASGKSARGEGATA